MAAVAGHEELLLGLFPTTQLADYLLPPLKRAGVPFDEAWDRALELVVWPTSKRDAKEWREQLARTRMTWQAAYEGWPPEQAELAISALREHADEDLSDLRETPRLT